MSGQLEKPQYSNDAEELENIRVFDVRHVLLEEQVDVETDGCHIINHIHRGFQKMTFVWTRHEPES